MLTIRLRRQGARNHPFYRVVLSDSRRTPRATALEELGYYDPTRNPKVLSLKEDRIDYWVGQGALVSETISKLRKKDFSASQPAEASAPAETKAAEPVTAVATEEASAEDTPEEATAEETTAEETTAEETAAEEAPVEEAPVDSSTSEKE